MAGLALVELFGKLNSATDDNLTGKYKLFFSPDFTEALRQTGYKKSSRCANSFEHEISYNRNLKLIEICMVKIDLVRV